MVWTWTGNIQGKLWPEIGKSMIRTEFYLIDDVIVTDFRGADDRSSYVNLLKELRLAFEGEAKSSNQPRLLLSAAVPASFEAIAAGWVYFLAFFFNKALSIQGQMWRLHFFSQLRRSRNFQVPWFYQRYDLRLPRTMGETSGTQFSTLFFGQRHQLPEKTDGRKCREFSNSKKKIYKFLYLFIYLFLLFQIQDYSAREWVKQGAPKEKLMIGMPTYGRSFTLVNESQFDIGAPASGGGTPGKYTGEAGFMSYYEVITLRHLFSFQVFFSTE